MTPKEIVAHLAPVDLDRIRLIFLYLAGNAHMLTLDSGANLHDAGDWKEFLNELADALGEAAPIGTARRARPLRDSTCHACGHVHQDDEECGVKMGGAGPCRCTQQVNA